MCVCVCVCVYIFDRNNTVRGNVNRRLPELSNYAPHGELLSPFTINIIVNHLLLSFVG